MLQHFFDPLLMLVQAGLFLAPGIALTLWLVHKKWLAAFYTIPVAGLVGSLLGLGVFWAYITHPLAGEWATVVALVAGFAGVVCICAAKPLRAGLRLTDVVVPLVLMFGVALFYSSTFLACKPFGGQSCYEQPLPMDNILPNLFATNVEAGKATELIGDWHGSDRPPLQSGIVLAQRMLTNQTYVGYNGYQLLATFLQCLWLPAMWAIGRALKASPKTLGITLAFCVITGFFFFNSIFVWPKLLAASLGILAFCLLLFEKRSALTWGIAGAAAGAAMLAHTGVVFTFIPVAALLLFPRFWPGIKHIAIAALIFAALVAPWLLYQKFYDPPGDRLVKWHIGGAEAVDDRSLGEALVDSYVQAGVATAIHNKLSNVRELFGSIPAEGHLYGFGKLAAARDADFRHTLLGLAVFNAGWIALCFPSIRARLRLMVDWNRIKVMLGIVAASLVLWVVLMFGPHTTIIHQGSYINMLLLFAALGAVLAALPKRWLLVLGCAQLAYFVVVWIISVIFKQPLGIAYLGWAMLGFVTTATVLYHILKTNDAKPLHAKHHRSY